MPSNLDIPVTLDSKMSSFNDGEIRDANLGIDHFHPIINPLSGYENVPSPSIIRADQLHGQSRVLAPETLNERKRPLEAKEDESGAIEEGKTASTCSDLWEVNKRRRVSCSAQQFLPRAGRISSAVGESETRVNGRKRPLEAIEGKSAEEEEEEEEVGNTGSNGEGDWKMNKRRRFSCSAQLSTLPHAGRNSVDVPESTDSHHLGLKGSGEPSNRAASRDNGNEPTTILFLVVHCMCAMVAGLLTGIEANVVGGVLTTRPFIDRFFHEEWMRQSLVKQDIVCRYVSIPIQLLNSAYTLAALPSFIVATMAFSRHRGYRSLLLLGASVHLIGHTSQFRANIRFLIASRIFIGAGVGILTLGFQSMIYNFGQYNHRGTVEKIYTYAVILGGPTSYVINTIGNLRYPNLAWKVSFLSTLPLSVLLLFFSCFYRFHGVGSNINTRISVSGSITSFFKEENRKKTMISTVHAIMIPLTDFGLFIAWTPIILLSLNTPAEVTFYVTLALSTIQCAFICFSPIFVNFLGRRYLLIGAGLFIMVLQAIIGYLMICSDNLQRGFPIKTAIGILVCLGIFQVFNGCLATTSGWLKDPLPDDCKLGSIICFQCLSFLMQLITAWGSLPLFCKLQSSMLFILLAIVGVMVILVYFLVM